MKKILPIFFVGLLILSGIGASGFSQTKSITSNVDDNQQETQKGDPRFN